MQRKTVLLMIEPYSQPRVEGIARHAKERGWNLMMADRLGRDEDPTSFDGVIMTLRDRPTTRQTAKRILASGIAVVDMTVECPDIAMPRVVSDHAALGRLAARHFAERGFENFAWYSSGWTNVHRLRMEGFRAELPAGAKFRRIAHANAAALLAAMPKPVAVLAYDDVDAARVVDVCRRTSIPIPQDVAVMGIGDDPLLCENQAPPISSVDQRLSQSAYEGAVLLGKLMDATPAARAAAARRKPFLVAPANMTMRGSSDTLAHSNPLVRRALCFIHGNLGNAFGAAQVADGIGMKRNDLDRLFAEELHHSVGSEILAQRLVRAKRLLADDGVPIAKIASTCGFCNPAYFTNTFIKMHGCTPSAWRRNHLSNRDYIRNP